MLVSALDDNGDVFGSYKVRDGANDAGAAGDYARTGITVTTYVLEDFLNQGQELGTVGLKLSAPADRFRVDRPGGSPGVDVAHAADGLDELGVLGVGFELAAEAGDAVVDGAVVALVVARRGEADELVAGEDAAGVGGEGGDEVDLHRAEVDGMAGGVAEAEGAQVEAVGAEAGPAAAAGRRRGGGAGRRRCGRRVRPARPACAR